MFTSLKLRGKQSREKKKWLHLHSGSFLGEILEEVRLGWGVDIWVGAWWVWVGGSVGWGFLCMGHRHPSTCPRSRAYCLHFIPLAPNHQALKRQVWGLNPGLHDSQIGPIRLCLYAPRLGFRNPEEPQRGPCMFQHFVSYEPA